MTWPATSVVSLQESKETEVSIPVENDTYGPAWPFCTIA